MSLTRYNHTPTWMLTKLPTNCFRMGNHQTDMRRKNWKDEIETYEFKQPFTEAELTTALQSLKNRKAAGLDDIHTEQLKNFGPTACDWFPKLFNNYAVQLNVPKIWRKAKVLAILKPGKDPAQPKSYWPISLLCHIYKLYERLILNELSFLWWKTVWLMSKLDSDPRNHVPIRSWTWHSTLKMDSKTTTLLVLFLSTSLLRTTR